MKLIGLMCCLVEHMHVKINFGERLPYSLTHLHSIFTTKRQRGDIMSLKKMDRIDCRINLNVKILSKEVCKDLGMSLTEAINLFLHQMIIHHGLPFEVKMTAEDRKLFILPDDEEEASLLAENVPLAIPFRKEAVSDGEILAEEAACQEDATLKKEPGFEEKAASYEKVPTIEEIGLSPGEEDLLDSEEILQ